MTSNTIIRQAYVRIGAWLGDPTEINAQYNADADFEQIVSEAFPAQSMWDMLTGVEGEMAQAVARNPNNTLRGNIADTVTATSGGLIPTIGASSATAKIIGEWGQVVGSGQPMTRGLHLDELRMRSQNPGTLYKSSLFTYVLVPPRIYATVTTLTIDCCVFDETVRAAAIEANGALLFPMAQNAYFDGLMSQLSNEDPNYTALSNMYRPLYLEWLAAQAEGKPVTEEADA